MVHSDVLNHVTDAWFKTFECGSTIAITLDIGGKYYCVLVELLCMHDFMHAWTMHV